MTRLQNLKLLVSECHSQQSFADSVGLSVQYLNQLLMGHRNIGEKTARKLERTLRLESGWLDRGAIEQQPAACAELSPRAVVVGRMFDRLSPDKQDAMQKVIAALAQSVDGHDQADCG
ncbi:MAG: helix-turn-helix transcriptional regulator [Candidatus Contendobacter sp.]|nr:helix-turn-helix transcriptional regulator [Candidatus Contendobacter sp.]MDG4556035.1 helix-turn-helix transcriptional regulator [Candidatus Contendobacter sp.]